MWKILQIIAFEEILLEILFLSSVIVFIIEK